MNDPGYVDTVGSKLVSHHADSPMQSVVAPDLEPWKLELIAKAQITYRFLFWTISVVIVFGMVLFSLRARLDRQIRQISVIWTELASFGGLIIYVSNIYLRGWPPETTGSGCFVPFWGLYMGPLTVVYALAVRSSRLKYLLEINRHKLQQSSVLNELPNQPEEPDEDGIFIRRRPLPVQTLKLSSMDWSEAFRNVMTFRLHPIAEGDDRVALVAYSVALCVIVTYLTVITCVRWEKLGFNRFTPCSFGFEWLPLLFLLGVTFLGYFPYLIARLVKARKARRLERNGHTQTLAEHPHVQQAYGDSAGVRRNLILTSVLGTLFVSSYVLWSLIPSGLNPGEPAIRLVWTQGSWFGLAGYVVHFVAVVLPLWQSYTQPYKNRRLANLWMDWLKESEPLPTRRTTRSTSPPQSQTSSRVINLDANISSRLALQSHDLSADTVVVTRSTSTRSALDTHNTSFVRTGGHDSTNIGGSLPRYYSDENSVTLTRPQRNRFFNWISSKMGHGKRIKTKNRPASLRTAFLGELFILVINDEEGFEELKRFSVKDFSVDNPIFYGEWRKLMASVLMSTGSLSEEVFILVDNMKSIRRLLENSTDDQIQRLGVFGWVRLQPDQGGRSGVSETVSMSSEEYGTSGPSISELVGLRPSRSQQFQTSTAASNIPSAYPPRKRRVPPNSIVNVFPDQPVPNELLGRFIQFYDIFIKPGHAPLEVGLPADISSDITLAIDAHRRMVRAKRENSRLAKRYLQSSTSALPISNMASAQLAAAQTQLLMSTVRAQIAQNVIDRVSILSDNPVISPVYPPPAPGTAQIGGDEQETKPLSVSVFDAAKDYILMSMFRETFPRFLGVPEGRRIVMDLMDKAERANPRMSRTGLRS